MTSFTKVWVVVSLIRSGAACGVAPLPCSAIVTAVLVGCLYQVSLGRAGSTTAREAMFSGSSPLRWRFAGKFQSVQGGLGLVSRTGWWPVARRAHAEARLAALGAWFR